VMMAAIKSGAVVSDTYSTNVAIWRVRTGQFHDYANLGLDAAQKIYSDSLGVKVEPIPEGVETFAQAAKAGDVDVKVENFTVVTDTNHPNLPGAPFHGTADVVVTNISKKVVKFLFVEGTVFVPANGEDAQSLLAHLDVQKAPELPVTGASFDEQNFALVLAAAFGVVLLLVGGAMVWRSYNASRA
jgi:hypothetical protein